MRILNTALLGGLLLAVRTPAAPADSAGFTRIGAETGIAVTNLLATSRWTTNQIYLNGSGVAAGDLDGDGRPDLLFAGLDNPNTVYRNLGEWHFEDITAATGLALPQLDCTGAALADLDGDGDLDAVLNTVGQGTHILFNDGKTHFSPVAVLNPNRAGMSLALADIDGDGDLDLYLANYRINTIRDDPTANIKGEFIQGKAVVAAYNDRSVTNAELVGRFTFGSNGKILEHGEVDLLVRNDGGGKFTPVPFAEAFFDENGRPLQSLPFDWGLSCMFRDVNGDGAPDLYVCNDFESPDRFWINQGNGKFRAAPARTLRHTSMFSMGVDFADIDRDGLDDFVVVDMLSRFHEKRMLQTGDVPPYRYEPGTSGARLPYSQNTLFLNRGDGTWAEASWLAGLAASEWSWTPAFLDVDLDGYEDLLITTGHQLEMMNVDVIRRGDAIKAEKRLSRLELLQLRQMFPQMNIPNVAFRNESGARFSDASDAWSFNEAAVSHGLALADLDQDGDLDVILNNLNSSASLYRNNASARRVAVRLNGMPPNTRGIGAKLKFSGGPVAQSQEMIAGGRYLSSDDAMRVFACGSNSGPFRLEVTWRNGKITTLEDVRPNQTLVVEESAARAVSTPARAETEPPFFRDVSSLLHHTHTDEFFDDLDRQPLLPMRLSHLGPGVAWHDFDGDGWDDLVVGSGRGGRLAIFQSRSGPASQRVFTPLAEPFLQRPAARDQTTILGLDQILLVGSANYEDGATNGGWTRIYDLNRKVAGENILSPAASTGPMALADVDGDGTLDLFIGGRAIAGRYPEPASSMLLQNAGTRFLPKQRFDQLGLVSGAVFSDLDLDGAPELILACQWGPVRVFRNEQGRFTEATEQLGLAPYLGLWNGVATGDFDNDGRPDIMASNWGLNSRWSEGMSNGARPNAKTTPMLRLYYGDLDQNGVLDLLESRYDARLAREVPLRGLRGMAQALPWLWEQIGTYEKYGLSSLRDIYGARLDRTRALDVTTLVTTLFLNRGHAFEARPLPAAAQMSPAFGVAPGDLDGDGNLDLFLSQNFFATHLEMPRLDAGCGLFLRGDGRGGFTALSPATSGLWIEGEQRGCALADYDHDGRLDLVVTQNSGPTRLYHNERARPGLRITVRGTATNPDGVGSYVRILTGSNDTESIAPAHEIQAGSGYWSQNSRTLVLALPPPIPNAPAPRLLVRRPGTPPAVAPIPPGATRVTVTPDGQFQFER